MKTGKNIKGALSYNEQKVLQGNAELIFASRFSRDVSEMGFSEKLARFEKMIGYSENVKTNTLHLSLNFSPDDHLDTETMQTIAADYMERIGFAGQPYLVYEHTDTTHPHLHIVTTTIRPNGKPINLHNIGKRLSEPARKAIELEYGLVKAESRKQHNTLPIQGDRLQSIVREVVSTYKFTSLDELNAILRQYNIIADRGAINSAMYQNNGLIYCKVDKDGYKSGVPVKASSIYTSPTLSVLEKKFEQNRVTKPVFQKKLQTKINSILTKSKTTAGFMNELKENKIGCSVQYQKDGTIKEISFIDHNNKSVFSSNDLGLSVDTILYKLKHTSENTAKPIDATTIPRNDADDFISLKKTASFDLLKMVLTTESHQPDLSPEFLKKRKKKRKR